MLRVAPSYRPPGQRLENLGRGWSPSSTRAVKGEAHSSLHQESSSLPEACLAVGGVEQQVCGEQMAVPQIPLCAPTAQALELLSL